MSRGKDSFLKPYFNSLKFKYRRRSINGRAANVIEALNIKNRFDQVPKVIKHGPSSFGYFILYNLPEGIEVNDFEKNLKHFNEQLGGKIRLTLKSPRTLLMDIVTYEWDSEILYNFTPSKSGIILPVGYDETEDLITVLLDQCYHILINGTTGGGKTNILHQWAYTLLQQGCILFLIDLMKREFSYLRNHAYLAFDAETASKFLTGLNEIMDKRLETLDKYEAWKTEELPFNMPRIVLMIDELGDVLLHKELGPELNRLARGGRSPAISIIAANQRNDSQFFGAEWGKTRHLFRGKLCFAVSDIHTSGMILGNDLASKIPMDKPGRAIWQYQNRENKEVQTMLYPNTLARTNIKEINSTKEGVSFHYDSRVHKRLPIGR